jgi:hypothetical protein
MSFYLKTPFKPTPKLLIQGTPEYVYGSFNDKAGPTLGNIISDSAVTTTATVVFQVTSGNIPAVNSLITVVGAANSANFNVTNATILTVVSTDAGVVTVTYAITSTSQGNTADSGQVYVSVPEVPDNLTAAIVTNLATNAGASFPVAAPVGSTTIGRSISVTLDLLANSTTYPSTLSGVTAVIQGANLDLDSEYNTIGTIGTALGAGTVADWQSGQGDTATGTLASGSVNLPNFRFYRLNITAATGAGYIVGKIMV